MSVSRRPDELVPGFHDVYVLARDRTAATAQRFLSAFAPHREQSAVDYCFPQYSERPSTILTSADDAIRRCESHPFESQSLYFRNLGSGAKHAMLFFTADGGLVLGLSVEVEPDEMFLKLREHARSETGYIDFEAPAPNTVVEFREICQRRATST